MKCLFKPCIHFLFFSFFFTVPCAVCVATPDQEFFPPLAPDQDKPFFEPHTKPPKDPENIINYRGTRIYVENEELQIAETEAERIDDDTIMLAIVFNQSINPRSVGAESFIVDDEPLPEETRFAFNRKGDTIRMVVYMSDDYFSLKVQNVSAFDGTMIEPVEIDVELADEEIQTEDVVNE